MKFKEMKLDSDISVVSIYVDDKCVLNDSYFGEIKHKLTRDEWNNLLEMEVKETNWYFEIFVIRLKG